MAGAYLHFGFAWRGQLARRAIVASLAPALMFSSTGCDHSPGSSSPAPSGSSEAAERGEPVIDLPTADQRLCTAVVILIDTSGSMSQDVPDRGGERRPKHVIARDALSRIVEYTTKWSAEHRDRVLQLGMFSFSSSATPILGTSVFDESTARRALEHVPRPGGGTAIGQALMDGFRSLYQSGCVRKHIVCITDGENTSGPAPDRVARALFAQTGGEVELHFVAFDTSAARFAFLNQVNGHVVEAANGEQLAARLAEIYEHRILAEAMPAEKE